MFNTDMHLAVCQHGANDTQESIEEAAHSTHDLLYWRGAVRVNAARRMLKCYNDNVAIAGWPNNREKRQEILPDQKKLRILQEGGKGTKLHKTTA